MKKKEFEIFPMNLFDGNHQLLVFCFYCRKKLTIEAEVIESLLFIGIYTTLPHFYSYMSSRNRIRDCELCLVEIANYCCRVNG